MAQKGHMATLVSTIWSFCLFLLVYLTWARKSPNRCFVKVTPSQTGVYIERRNKHKLLHRIRSDWSLLIYNTVFPHLTATNYWISTQSHFGLKLGASNHCFKPYKVVWIVLACNGVGSIKRWNEQIANNVLCK